MNFFRRRSAPTSESLQRNSCSGCSSCFSKPIESMPLDTQTKLDSIRGKLIEARVYYANGRTEDARTKSKEVKRLVGELSSLGDFRKAIDSMFTAHVPEAEIQKFIATA